MAGPEVDSLDEACAAHPGRAAVARCARCGRPACLGCATPVRGEIIGPECLAEVLGGIPDQAPAEAPRSGRPMVAVALLGFLVAVGGSALPWTRSSIGAGFFGAWGFSPLRWSALAAAASLAGALIAAGRFLSRREPTRGWRWTMGAAAVLSMAGAVMHLIHPPAFTTPWLGPWVTLGGVVVAAPAVVLGGRSEGSSRGV